MGRRARLTRRAALAGALGGVAGLHTRLARAVEDRGGGLVAPAAMARDPHFEPKAKQLVFVFLTGGFSHVDTFDPKPRLSADSGKPVPSFGLRSDETKDRPLLGSPFRFERRGESGLPISELFPSLGGLADELCVLRGLHTDIVEHFQATLAMHTGSATVPMPSVGAWLSYGLGTFNANLPAYVVLAEHLPYAGSQVWDASFLPPEHQGVRIKPGAEPIPDLKPAAESATLAELEQRMLEDLNEEHARSRGRAPDLRARMAAHRTAEGLMREAPEVFDTGAESAATRALYGTEPGDRTSFGAQCLIARRLVERGVRVVELIDTGSHDNWDAHGDMQQHRGKAARVDRALGALLSDLKRRGLLSQTLVAICTEFGRTPWTDGPGARGRNHYAKAFSCLLAGAGVRGGMAFGETDEYGISIVKDGMHVHDYHATILHLMGIEHTRLTYRYAGRDFRLTDVSGRVATEILS